MIILLIAQYIVHCLRDSWDRVKVRIEKMDIPCLAESGSPREKGRRRHLNGQSITTIYLLVFLAAMIVRWID